MRVVFSPDAQRDLASISDYIDSENPVRARSFVAELAKATRAIGLRPRGYRLRPELGEAVRARIYRRYAILFEIDGNVVHVLRVVHAARDLAALMDDDPDAE